MDKQVEEYLQKIKEKQKNSEELLESEKTSLEVLECGGKITLRAIEMYQQYLD